MTKSQTEREARGGSSGVFRKARRTRFIQDILGQIEQAIIDGNYREGDKLPSERQLCNEFQTSRGPLREALRVLEQKGLIAVKAGARGGAYVKAVTAKHIGESLGFLLRFKGVTLAELSEFRAFLEGAAAALAARRARKADVLELRRLVEEARAHHQDGALPFDSLLEADSRFHEALAEASRNRLFMSVLETVYANMHQYQDTFLPRDEKTARLLLKDLSDITAAVESKDAEKAQRLMQRHIHKFNRLAEKGQRRRADSLRDLSPRQQLFS